MVKYKFVKRVIVFLEVVIFFEYLLIWSLMNCKLWEGKIDVFFIECSINCFVYVEINVLIIVIFYLNMDYNIYIIGI